MANIKNEKSWEKNVLIYIPINMKLGTKWMNKICTIWCIKPNNMTTQYIKERGNII